MRLVKAAEPRGIVVGDEEAEGRRRERALIGPGCCSRVGLARCALLRWTSSSVVAGPLHRSRPNLKLDVRRRETSAEFESRCVGFLQPIFGEVQPQDSLLVEIILRRSQDALPIFERGNACAHKVGGRQTKFDERASIRRVGLDEPNTYRDGGDVDDAHEAAFVGKHSMCVAVDRREVPLYLRQIIEVAGELRIHFAEIGGLQHPRKSTDAGARRTEAKGHATLKAKFEDMMRRTCGLWGTRGHCDPHDPFVGSVAEPWRGTSICRACERACGATPRMRVLRE